jgi:hypothetical protein
MRIKRLWSFYDPELGRRFYADILQMPDDRRRRLVRQYAQFLEQLRSVRRAMADYFAGQQFFEFYIGDADEELLMEPQPVRGERSRSKETKTARKK